MKKIRSHPQRIGADGSTVRVWRAPDTEGLLIALNGLVGGCIGPIGCDRAWARGALGPAVAVIGDAGVRALVRRAGDPSDAATIVAGARCNPEALAAAVARARGAQLRPGRRPASGRGGSVS